MYTNKKNRMLIVEDDALQLFQAKKVLESQFEIESVSNGYQALELMENKDFDIVLLDINLGDARMDGIKVMRTIRKDRRYKYAKIIAVTAYSDLRDWYISEGFNDLIIKPIISDTIFDILNKVPEKKVGQFIL
jgi:two-component system, sensor histidine kinase and response regulator